MGGWLRAATFQEAADRGNLCVYLGFLNFKPDKGRCQDV